MSEPPDDPSVFKEPHLRQDSNPPAARELAEEEQLRHTVWDEPALAPELVGQRPAEELTYRVWLEKRRAGTSWGTSWAVTLAVTLAAGPWAVLGAFWGAGGTWISSLAIIVFAPLAEEMMKIAAALYVVELKPYLFRSSFQILICVLAGGLVFSVLENLLYQYVYLSDPTPGLIRWRWTVCVALHVGCSCIAGLGLRRIWLSTWRYKARPQITLAYPYIVTAVIVHGSYNGFATLLDMLDFQF